MQKEAHKVVDKRGVVVQNINTIKRKANNLYRDKMKDVLRPSQE